MISSKALRRARGVSVTFRGYLPGEQLVQDVKREAARIEGVDDVHAVIRFDVASSYFEVMLEARCGGELARCTTRHRDARVAISQAFDRLGAGRGGMQTSAA